MRLMSSSLLRRANFPQILPRKNEWVSKLFEMNSCSWRKGIHFCVVGSGPAGFYVTESILKNFDDATVDIIEKLPTPFGLVRSGVAPDHPDTKNVINRFTRVASDSRCNFFGNVRFGRDISLPEIRSLYPSVILAYGAESEKKLGIPGENLPGVFSSHEFVFWYNGHIEHTGLNLDLQATDTAVILGQGNVALDIARILLDTTDNLRTTDITQPALETLQASQIKNVKIFGRRGPAQVSFTAKEFRELLRLSNVSIKIKGQDLILSELDQEELKTNRSKKRVFELMQKAANESPGSPANSKEIEFVFYRSPTKILPSSETESSVKSVQFEATKLQPASTAKGSPQRAVGTGIYETVDCGLVVKSIGYRSEAIDGIPFDPRNGIVPNERGRVLRVPESEEERFEPGLYVSGWLKRGPSGIIGTNLVDAKETVECIAEDLELGKLPESYPLESATESLKELLHKRGVYFVNFEEWTRIDKEERRRGEAVGKPREKILSLEEMLYFAKQ